MSFDAKAFLIASLLLLLSACDETDAVAVRIRLRDDFSGQVTTSNVALMPAESPLQQSTQGVEWQSRVEILCGAGHFAALSAVKMADIDLSSGEGSEGLAFARVSLPRGEAARWHKLLVPLTAEERASSALAIDPSGRTKNVASTIKIEIELPSAVVGNGLTGRAHGIKVKAEGSTATLVVPLDVAQSAGDPIVWHLTWQR
jgi:hypothetical protein